MSLAVSELMRIVERMVIIGTVVELDPTAARVKVSLGPGVVSGWLPFAQLGSKDVRIWVPPVKGSQVVVFSPGGNTARGIVYPGPYDGVAPDDRDSAVSLSMPGLDLSVVGGVATIELSTMNVKGNIIVDGDVVASGVSLTGHTHSGVTGGGSNTGGPS
ncbi:phage baseplate assembly protein V [Salipiger sp. IMCC34102]|uniref:phage baseplate assembly protein V n=1 Tax=Salipiger sp. IMCC34102 TaxID=2510647 RepID=UPI00101BC90E|nr:phage baseplate assembly protein V [Salipiger sp. IMCC34102]RYH04127.1 phage baseplate assembly protein V [Salipiger sp. IMCC34102]